MNILHSFTFPVDNLNRVVYGHIVMQETVNILAPLRRNRATFPARLHDKPGGVFFIMTAEWNIERLENRNRAQVIEITTLKGENERLRAALRECLTYFVGLSPADSPATSAAYRAVKQALNMDTEAEITQMSLRHDAQRDYMHVIVEYNGTEYQRNFDAEATEDQILEDWHKDSRTWRVI